MGEVKGKIISKRPIGWIEVKGKEKNSGEEKVKVTIFKVDIIKLSWINTKLILFKTL